MNSPFGEVFLFLTNLAWKCRLSMPMLVTTVFLIMDIRLQIEINMQSGQVAAAELDQLDGSDDEIDEYTSDDSTDVGDDEDDELEEDEHDGEDVLAANAAYEEEVDEYESTANRLRRSLGLS